MKTPESVNLPYLADFFPVGSLVVPGDSERHYEMVQSLLPHSAKELKLTKRELSDEISRLRAGILKRTGSETVRTIRVYETLCLVAGYIRESEMYLDLLESVYDETKGLLVSPEQILDTPKVMEALIQDKLAEESFAIKDWIENEEELKQRKLEIGYYFREAGTSFLISSCSTAKVRYKARRELWATELATLPVNHAVVEVNEAIRDYPGETIELDEVSNII